MKQSKQDYELSQMLLDGIEGISGELEGLIPDIDFEKPISDAKIKQAILEFPGRPPEVQQALYDDMGFHNYIKFLSEFSEGKQW